MPETVETPTQRRIPRYPFGNPDGARADIREVLHGFVGLHDEAFQSALGDPAEDLSARLIVGRLGAGKTMYLRRAFASAEADQATYADAIRNDLPRTEEIIDVTHRLQTSDPGETWSEIWRCAILRALATHLIFVPALRQAVPPIAVGHIEEDFRPLLGRPSAPRSPYDEVAAIIRKHGSRTALDRYLKHPRWPDLRHHLAQALRSSPPVYFHLDALDDRFTQAPMYWLKFQEGLFLRVVDLLRDADFGGRLHVVACIRDVVYSHVLRSENAGRYGDEPHIRVLDWNLDAIRELLNVKIARLGAFHRMDPSVPGVPGWLGVTEIENPSRGIVEPIESYLLRHTRLLPRDVVKLGNSLCREIAKAKGEGATALAPETIRAIVDGSASSFANIQLEASSNQIAADLMPANAVADHYADVYLADRAYQRGIAEELRAIVGAVGRDRFDGLQLEVALREAQRRFAQHVRPEALDDVGRQVLDVLWQQGLIGYQAKRESFDDVRFFARSDVNDFHLPLNRQAYVFHSCVTHAVPIEPIGPPVPPA
jgi:hypothetical protein